VNYATNFHRAFAPACDGTVDDTMLRVVFERCQILGGTPEQVQACILAIVTLMAERYAFAVIVVNGTMPS
jgi:hypothetical protein